MLRFSWALLIVCMAGLSVVAARYSIAHFYFQRAHTTYNSTEVSSLNYGHQLNFIIEDVDRSLALRPLAADSLDLKANLLYQSWWLSPDGQYLNDSKKLKAAESLHLDAQKIRKNWSFSAARLALIYSFQESLDERFEYWFLEAHRLGLYETRIARSLMLVGLQNWTRLNAEQQIITIDFVRSSIEQKSNSANFMKSVLNQYNKHKVFCEVLVNTPRASLVCNG